jgi:hypothetical protein
MNPSAADTPAAHINTDDCPARPPATTRHDRIICAPQSAR